MESCGNTLTQLVPLPFQKNLSPSFLKTSESVELGINLFCLCNLLSSIGATILLLTIQPIPPISKSVIILYYTYYVLIFIYFS